MTRHELDAFLRSNGVAVDEVYSPHAGGNKFCDLYIGIGEPYEKLLKIRDELRTRLPREIQSSVKITSITNPDHVDYPKRMLEVSSFWNE